jgi:hypothetical protein
MAIQDHAENPASGASPAQKAMLVLPVLKV